MTRIALLTALTLAGFALTADEASAQGRRGGRGGYSTPSYGNGNGGYYGNGVGTQLGNVLGIPGNGWSGNNSWYGSNTRNGNSPRYSSGQFYGTLPSYSTTSGYYTVPQTTIAPSTYYMPIETSQIATLLVQLPTSDAQVWLNDTLTTSPTGVERQFQSPPLDPSKNYSYTVKALWIEDGKVMEKTRDVQVEPNKTSTVSFR